jgi:hypothetical protein
VIAGFVSGLGGKLAERWIAAVLSSAFAFWAGGLVAWAAGHERGWERIGAWITGLSNAVQLALAVGLLLGVTASGILVQRLTLPILRLLEGYWFRWLGPIRATFIKHISERYADRERRWEELAPKIDERRATSREREEYAQLDRSLRRVPLAEAYRMPTRLGNILRAAESWPWEKYRLDAVKCWPRLWLVLPETARAELTASRTELDAAAGIWLWGFLFIGWSVWSWWAAPVGVIVMIGAYVGMLQTAAVYGDLLESAFDLHRPALYEALRWPLPANPSDDRTQGAQVTDYLWRGSDAETPQFIAPEKS